tara:strand:+ start:136 stop:816 length:681 start_codon:yes stop_codon:yes gene_type:complete
MNRYDFPKNSFIGGWFIPEDTCDKMIDFFNHSREKVNHVTDKKLQNGGDVAIEPGLILAQGNIGNSKIIDYNKKDSIDLSVETFGNLWNNNSSIVEWKKYLQMCLEEYLKEYTYCNEMTSFYIREPVNMQHYKPGGGFKTWHFENSSPVSMTRKLVFMTYLNDVPNGGTHFYYQDLKSPAKKGLTLIWPADWTHTHRGIVDNENDKYIITGWYSYETDELANYPWM